MFSNHTFPYTVVIEKPEWQVHQASHCDSKQQ